LNLSNTTLYAANGSLIPTYGQISRELDLGLRRKFQFSFQVADTQTNILGADFLEHFHLCPDIRDRRLLDGTTLLSRNLSLRECDQPSVSTINSSLDPRIQELLKLQPQSDKVTSRIEHHIVTTPGPPIFCRPRRLVGERLTTAKKYFKKMMQDGI